MIFNFYIFNLSFFLMLLCHIQNLKAQNIENESQVVLRAFGDSHADIFQIEALKNVPVEYSNQFKSFSYSNYGRLMYSVGRDGLKINELLGCPNKVIIRPWKPTERRRILYQLLIPGVVMCTKVNAPPVTKKDIFYFIFGEIDARHKLAEMMFRENRTNIAEEINNLVDKYMKSVRDAVSQFPIKTVLIGGIHPQPIVTENTNGWSPVTGSFDRRWIHTLLINRKLKQHCEKLGYHFVDFTEGYSMPDGSLNMTMTDGNHHLNLWTEQTKNELAEIFVNHLKSVCSI